VLKAVQAYGTLVCFIGLIAVFSLLLPGTFLTGRNIANISQQVSMLAVVAFSMTIVMAMGDFDISVGSMASLAGVVAAVAFRETGSVPLGILLALATGLAGGVLNGILVSYIGVLPFIATLGTLTIFSGLAFLVSNGRTIFGADIPEGFSALAKGGLPLWTTSEQTIVLPNLTTIALTVLAGIWFMMHKLAFGRHLYAMGGNAEAARLAGINVQATRLAAFALAGLGAALAGLMLSSRVASSNPIQGAGLMLDAIAAVFLGMTISRHGEPRPLNTLVGVLLLGVLSNGLTQFSIGSYIRDILVGSIVIAAVAIASSDKLRRN
jgi:ribose transport system permease protein